MSQETYPAAGEVFEPERNPVAVASADVYARISAHVDAADNELLARFYGEEAVSRFHLEFRLKLAFDRSQTSYKHVGA